MTDQWFTLDPRIAIAIKCPSSHRWTRWYKPPTGDALASLPPLPSPGSNLGMSDDPNDNCRHSSAIEREFLFGLSGPEPEKLTLIEIIENWRDRFIDREFPIGPVITSGGSKPMDPSHPDYALREALLKIESSATEAIATLDTRSKGIKTANHPVDTNQPQPGPHLYDDRRGQGACSTCSRARSHSIHSGVPHVFEAIPIRRHLCTHCGHGPGWSDHESSPPPHGFYPSPDNPHPYLSSCHRCGKRVDHPCHIGLKKPEIQVGDLILWERFPAGTKAELAEVRAMSGPGWHLLEIRPVGTSDTVHIDREVHPILGVFRSIQ